MGVRLRRDFDNMVEFVEFAMRDSAMPNSTRSSRDRGRESFFGSSSFSEAQAMAFDWKDGANRVKKMQAQVSLGNVRKRRVVQARRSAPGRIHMGRVAQGNPYAFVRTVNSDQDAKGPARNVVTIFLNVCVSSGVSTNTIEARGAGVLALVDALEQNGKRARVIVGMANGRGDNLLDYRITVKQPGQRVNLQSIAFGIAHPSMFRRFIFSAMETESAEVRQAFNVGMGYGTVREFDPETLPANAIYLGGASLDYGMRDKWNDPAYVKSWITDTLAEQGITLADRQAH